MQKTISGSAMLMLALPSWAQETAAEVPVPSAADADPTALIVCAVLFVVLVAAFFAYMWMQGRKSHQKGE